MKKKTMRKEIEAEEGRNKEEKGVVERGEATNAKGKRKKREREVDLARELRRVPSARENLVNLVCLTSRLVDGLGPRKVFPFGLPRHAYDLPVVKIPRVSLTFLFFVARKLSTFLSPPSPTV